MSHPVHPPAPAESAQAQPASHADFDLAVIGGGPAGLAAAAEAAQLGLAVLLLDEQEAPGGQIYRAIERSEADGRATTLGADYRHGAALARRFRASGAQYRPGAQVWQVERDGQVYFSDGAGSQSISARRVLVAVGALERAVAVPGWTLPGVMTVGAAQILLKTAALVPDEGVWLAGSGPLPLLYATQLADAGGRIAGYLDTTPAGNRWEALPYLLRALRNDEYIEKGIALRRQLKRAGFAIYRNVEAVEAVGQDRLTHVRFQRAGGWWEFPATGLLLHEGVVPNVHVTMALGCAHAWDGLQRCFRPVLDEWGQTDIETILVAGDCGGIVGARAAEAQGRLAAVGCAFALGRLSLGERDHHAAELRGELDRHIHVRPFLDRLFLPRRSVLVPANHVTICRCESVTAGQVREAVALGCLGPNQVKSFTRCGMGPCQGRLCGLPVAELIAAARGVAPGDAGFYNIRPPLKPITLDELASLAPDAAS